MAPRPDLLHPLAKEWLDQLPHPLGTDPDIHAVIHCYMREEERKRTRIEEVRAQFSPLTATELGLPWWEKLLRLTVAPAGWTVEQRRDAVVASIRRLRVRMTGLDQEGAITRLIGPGWTYEEHDPAVPTSPPPGVVRFYLPTLPAGDLYERYERMIRGVIETHLDIETQFEGGFVLDEDLLDEGLLG
ncbi:MAG TPA: putative phage tail protein [Longimicrobiales bacterium]